MTSAGTEKPKFRGVIGRWLFLFVAAGTIVVALLTTAGFFARWEWRCELACHFRLQYFWLLAIAAVVLLVMKHRAWATTAAAMAAVNLAMVAPIYWPVEQPNATGAKMRLVSFNVLGSNDRYDDVLAMLRKEDADVILLMEIKPEWARQIEGLRDEYPHQHVVPRGDNFGIALLSRLPWTSVETHYFGSAEVPTIVAAFESGGRPMTLVGTHPVPPGSATLAAERNEQLAEIGSFLGKNGQALVVAGDLNVTSYSPYFHDLLKQTNLRDSRQGFGVQASWSSPLPLLSIPIDHCLISPEIAILSRRIGPHLGSDHRAVIVELQLPGPPEPTGR